MGMRTHRHWVTSLSGTLPYSKARGTSRTLALLSLSHKKGRRGGWALGHMHRHLASKLGPTWRVVYEQALVTFKQTPVTHRSVPSVWKEAWAKSASLKRLVAYP